MKKTSEHIREIRAIKDIKPDARYYKTLDGEQIPGIYHAHMSAIETERQLDHARQIALEMFLLLKDSAEGPCLPPGRQDEIEGLILLWGIHGSATTRYA